jgi:hypothetical protein
MTIERASDNPFPSVLMVEGTTPATPAASTQRLFVRSSDHVLCYVNAAGTVTAVGAASGLTDPMTTRGDIIVRNASNVTARLGRGSASQVLTSDGTDVAWATPSSGSLGWTLDVNQPGTSFAAWAANTSDGGTWASNGTQITQTSTSATVRRARLSAQTPLGWPTIVQCDVNFASISGGINRAGIGITDGTSTGWGFLTYLEATGDTVITELDTQVVLGSYSVTVNTATWYTLRMVINGYWIASYVDGTFKGNAMMNTGTNAAPRNSAINSEFITLTTYGASVLFRNIKVWSLSTGAP